MSQPITFTPLIRGRLLDVTSANGEPVNAESMIEREANLTWFKTLPENNLVIEGEWWSENDPVASVSIDKGIATSMNLALGDRLNFTAGGMNFEATVSSLERFSGKVLLPTSFYSIA